MIELESKIALFRKMTLSEERKKAEEERAQSKEQTQHLLESRKNQIDAADAAYYKEHEKRARAKGQEALAQAKDTSKRAIREVRSACFEELRQAILARFLQFKKEPTYSKWLEERIRLLLPDFPEADLALEESDLAVGRKILGEKVQILPLDPGEMGGFILLSKDRTRRVRYTFRSLVEEASYEIGRDLHDRLMDAAPEGKEGQDGSTK